MLKFFERFIKSSQTKIDVVSAEIKTIKKQIKITDIAANELKKKYYERDLLHFEELLQTCKQKLESEYCKIDFFYGRNGRKLKRVEILERKKDLLSKIIYKIKAVLNEETSTAIMELEWLYMQFLSIENSIALQCSQYLEVLKVFPIYQEIFSLKDQLKFLIKLLFDLLNCFFGYLKRDLRKFHRSIIHFLFKNMDDESAEYKVLKRSISKSFLNSVIHFLYEKEGNNSTIICNT